MRYFAVLDIAADTVAARTEPRNVFVVEDQADPVALVVLDRTSSTWLHNSALVAFVAGERSDECREISEAEASTLVVQWGVNLPSYQEVRALAR